jgi:predicted small lipoprotein YifL
MRKYLLPVAIIISIFLGLTACGQKGPLYLPGSDAPKEKQK